MLYATDGSQQWRAQCRCSQGVGLCGLEEVYPPSFSAFPYNSPSRPWPDGFQMLCSLQRPSAPPKATVLASS